MREKRFKGYKIDYRLISHTAKDGWHYKEKHGFSRVGVYWSYRH